LFLAGKNQMKMAAEPMKGYRTASADSMGFVACSHRTGKPKKSAKGLMLGGDLRTRRNNEEIGRISRANSASRQEIKH